MIDLHSERVIPLREVNRLPYLKGRGGKRMNFSTIWRWSLRGIKGVRLATMKIGGQTYTSEEAVERFIEQLNNPGEPVVRSSRQRQKAIERAEARLDAMNLRRN